MRERMLRMADCGIPMSTAIKVCTDFWQRGKLLELDKYIEQVEAIQLGRVETVQS